MTNRNESLKWLHDQPNIFVAEEIENYAVPVRGIYGIFVIDKDEQCVYVGRSSSIYGRMFNSDNGHIAKLMRRKHENLQLMDAMQKGKRIEIRVLNKVPLQLDNYYKDMQRLASAESALIDHYQEYGQCLEQLPEGKWIKEEEWRRIKEKMNIGCYLCRFFPCEQWAKDFVSGKIYMNSISYFYKCEQDGGVRSDELEGTDYFGQNDGDLELFIAGIPITEFSSFRFRNDTLNDLKKLCCLYQIKVDKANGKLLPIDPQVKSFGEYVVVFTNSAMFIDRLQKAANSSPQLRITGNPVQYMDLSTYSGKATPFIKDKSYDWQNEYRIFLKSEDRNPYILDIGDLSDICMVMSTEEMLKSIKLV